MSVQYFVEFDLKKPVSFPNIKLPQDIILKTTSENKVVKIEILVPNTWDKIQQIAIERLENFEAILSFNLNFKFNYTYIGWYRTADATKRKSIIDSDLTKRNSSSYSSQTGLNTEEILAVGDYQFWKKMRLFAKGVKSQDPVKKYINFYQIVEDETNLVNDDEKALRESICNPFVASMESAKRLKKIIGQSYFSPFNKEHLKIILEYASKLQKKARKILVTITR